MSPDAQIAASSVASTPVEQSVAPSSASTTPTSDDQSLPTPGNRWRGIYQIGDALTDGTGARGWQAVHASTMEEVILRVVRPLDAGHATAWEKLQALETDRLQSLRDLQLLGKVRIEIYAKPVGIPLRAWRAARPSLEVALVEWIVREAAAALGELHARGLVHLNLRPDTVFATEEQGAPRVMIGGLECVTKFDQTGEIPIAVDPFYAPPEALGKTTHPAGPALRAWDWWSLGRVLQEALLGRHVLGLLLDRDVSRPTPEMRKQAEALLEKRGPGGTRAGAVEAMPKLDKRIDSLLRGLLSSSRDARWGAVEVDRWLRHEPVKERYAAAANKRFFRWHDQVFWVGEAAHALRTPEHWAEAAEQICDADNPTTLISFIQAVPELQAARTKLEPIRALLTDGFLQTFPAPILREVVAAVALQALAGGKMVWRGQPLTAAAIRDALAQEDGSGQAFAPIYTLACPVVTDRLKVFDAEAAKLLRELEVVAAQALARAWMQYWLPRDDYAGMARIWSLALEAPATLKENFHELHRCFAASTNAAMESMFKADQPSSTDLILLAFVADRAEQLGFISHAEWERRIYTDLAARGQVLAATLFWHRLKHALSAGPLCFGRFRWLIPCWGALVLLFSVAWPGPRGLAVAVAPMLAMAVLRWIPTLKLAPLLRVFSPASTRWRLRDGTLRCQQEIKKLQPKPLSPTELASRLDNTNTEIRWLTQLQPPPATVPIPPTLVGLWLTALSTWLLLFAILGFSAWRIYREPPSLETWTKAWFGQSAAAEEVTAILKTETPAPTKIAWPFKQPPLEEIRAAKIHSTLPATPAQVAAAEARAATLLEAYDLKTVKALIAVRVPTEQYHGFILLNAQTGQVFSPRVFVMVFHPATRSWITIEQRPAFVFGN